MAITAAITGFGAKLQIGDGATPVEAFTTIAEVKNISGPSSTLETVDATNQDSTVAVALGVPARERIASMFDEGTVQIDGNFIADNVQHLAIRNDQRKGTRRNFKLQFSDPTPQVAAFAGFITAFSREHPFDAVASFSMTVTLTGVTTWT